MSKEIRIAAMNLLARREHSFKELTDKLARRFDGSDAIIETVQLLADENLQCDARFAEIFVRSRINKCHGPIRIKNELCQRGVSERLVSSAIHELQPDWYEIIQRLSDKKYGDITVEDVKAKAKRIRFFQYRGFSSDHIESVL